MSDDKEKDDKIKDTIKKEAVRRKPQTDPDALKKIQTQAGHGHAQSAPEIGDHDGGAGLMRSPEKSWVHPNLHKIMARDPRLISVKVPGRKIRYEYQIALKDVEFKVHESGRLKTLATGQRNVHAWAVGKEISMREVPGVRLLNAGHNSWRRAVYDPWKGSTFVDLETLKPVEGADYAIMVGKELWYHDESASL